MIITGEKFSQIGEALFGPRWKAVLADMMCRDNRMIRYYSDGRTPVPVELLRKLAVICRTRGAALIRIADELESVG